MEELYKVYIKWMALPLNDKKPRTKTEFAEKHKITAADLLGFEDRETFGEDVLSEMKKWAKRKTPELIHILYDKYSKSKSPNDLKVWMDVIKDVKEKNEEPQTVNNIVNIFNPNDEQKRQIAERITRRVTSLPAGSEE
jgi:hypothetical protein